MSIAVDTNVLVRFLVKDDAAQFKAAKAFVDRAAESGEPLLILLCALMETEWVLRSRYKLDKASIASAFAQLLESRGLEFEHEPTVEEAMYLWTHHASADFADCLLLARSVQMGRNRFLTFDAGAAKLPHAELLR
ncbi:MAG TPA: type II toxin-antitoxin system VapC family toxin [Burkholderiaceae bacterium]|jgi:predicted nucleic-acid-binding protein